MIAAGAEVQKERERREREGGRERERGEREEREGRERGASPRERK